jgi:hypothetical protein
MATFSGKTFGISTTPQNANLDDHATLGFPGLTYVNVTAIGNYGDTGNNTNIVTYPTLDEDVIAKDKGMTDAGSPEIECRRIATDPGQIAMRAAGLHSNTNKYAFRTVDQDGTVHYNRGLVTGPTRPGGGNEDFERETFTLGLVQTEVVVNPTP